MFSVALYNWEISLHAETLAAILFFSLNQTDIHIIHARSIINDSQLADTYIAMLYAVLCPFEVENLCHVQMPGVIKP